VNFAFAEEQERFRGVIKNFFQSDEVQQVLKEIKETGEEVDPRKLYRIMGEQGFLAVNWPIEYGGQGKTMVESAIVAEEMSRNGIPESLHVISIQIVGMLLLKVATEKQKQLLLPPMAKGEAYACVLYTEPSAGSDLGGLKTRAELDQDGYYRIYGEKVYNMKTHLCDYGLCAARTTTRGTKYDGITLFMVPLKSEGVSLTKIDSLADESFYKVTLNGVRVSPEMIIGEVDNGWPVINKMLAIERTGLDYYIRAERWYHMILQNAYQNGLVRSDSVLIELAKLGSKLDAARFLTYKSIEQMEDRGHVDESLAAISKWYCSELACEIIWKGLEVRGIGACLGDSHGYPEVYGSLEAAYREAPGLTISAGTSEMMLETLTKIKLTPNK
jgi:alkylation response protein AidB-like acyl-CoA dehydrogenase